MSVRSIAIIVVCALSLSVSTLFAAALLNAATFAQAALAIVLYAVSMAILAASAIILSKKALAPLEDNLKAIDRLLAGDYGAEGCGADPLSAALGALSASLRDESCACRGFLQILPNAAMELDKNGHIAWLNDAANVWFAGDRCLGRPLADLLAADERPGFMALLGEAALSGSVLRREVHLHISGAGATRYQVICVPILRDGDIIGWRCIARDVEAMVKLQEELVRARNESQVMTEKLNRTISDLEEFALLAIRREFKMQELRERFANIKHEHNLKKNIIV